MSLLNSISKHQSKNKLHEQLLEAKTLSNAYMASKNLPEGTVSAIYQLTHGASPAELVKTTKKITDTILNFNELLAHDINPDPSSTKEQLFLALEQALHEKKKEEELNTQRVRDNLEAIYQECMESIKDSWIDYQKSLLTAK